MLTTRRKNEHGKPRNIWDYRGWIITREQWISQSVYLAFQSKDHLDKGDNTYTSHDGLKQICTAIDDWHEWINAGIKECLSC